MTTTETNDVQRWNINDIETEARRRGSHWFDAETLRFFGSRIHSEVYQGPGGVFFVSSEKSGSGDAPRAFSVRQWFPASADVDTYGEVCSHSSRSTAHTAARTLAASPVQFQFYVATRALDRAITGKDQEIRHEGGGLDCRGSAIYGTLKDAAEGMSRGEIYLSDGGYTRLFVKQYDDSGGFFLKLCPTWADEAENEKTREKFNAAYDRQREVARVIKTYVEGGLLDEARYTQEQHRPETLFRGFVRQVREHGHQGATLADCRRLIKAAARHDLMMIRKCNGLGATGDTLDRARSNIKRLAVKLGASGVVLGGDPRGCTCKLTFSDGFVNDFGKEGFCVPTKIED